jgi:dihydroflavonol-4-reductase
VTEPSAGKEPSAPAKKILVTGASGFIGSHCVLDLLQHGYQVRGTVRNLDRAEALRAMLAKHHNRASEIELLSADLMSADGWTEAMQGCDGVFHVASPVPTIQPKDPAEVIEPARQGTLNVLAAAKYAGVRRVVLTSSIAAVFGNAKANDDTYTSDDWSDPYDPDLTPYAASKTLAEKAAWNFVSSGGPELATINPGMVLGPALETDYGSSLELLHKLFAGAAPMAPKLGFEVVDVRDVAALHRLVLEHPSAAGQRFLCGAGFRWIIDIAKTLHGEFPDRKKLPGREMPNILARIFAIFVKEIAGYIGDLDVIKKLDCTPARDIGWQPRSPEEATIAGGRSLVELGVI